MAIRELEEITLRLKAQGKGILAADESQATIEKRFTGLHIESTVENRRAYREILFTTPGLESFISGVILHEETLGQRSKEGVLFPEVLAEQGMIPGVKVDKGLIALNTEEKMTEGLDGLAKRLQVYKHLGACFAKWRAVFTLSDQLPSRLAQVTNAQALARYASICQANGIVPIVEPELLMEGNHSLARCAEATTQTLTLVFEALAQHEVMTHCMLLKPSMVIAGSQHAPQPSIREVAQATLAVLVKTVPPEVPSINFLSGGQSPELATAHLNEMNSLSEGTRPWHLSFSYGRALQEPALKAWNGKAHNAKIAQAALYHRAKMNAAASKGLYQKAMEVEESEAEPTFVSF